LVACSGTTAASVTPEPSATSVRKLDALVESSPRLLAEICNQARQLATIWPDEQIPSLIAEHFLRRHRMVAQLDATGIDETTAVELLIRRC
jgi:hypothetical protein